MTGKGSGRDISSSRTSPPSLPPRRCLKVSRFLRFRTNLWKCNLVAAFCCHDFVNGLIRKGSVVVVGGAGKKRDILIRRRHPMIAVPRGGGGGGGGSEKPRTSGGLRVSRSTCNRVLPLRRTACDIFSVCERLNARTDLSG